jgi:multiple sugar transport system permease protein
MVLFTAGPMILSLMMSFTDWDIIRPAMYRGVANYTEAFGVDQRFWPSIQVTLLYTLFSVPFGLVVALALALLLNVKVKGMPVYRTLYYLPSLASAVASSLIWKMVFRADGGLLNLVLYSGPATALGIPKMLSPLAGNEHYVNWLGSEKTALSSLILMSMWGAGGGMIILLAGLQGVPQFLYEAATVDGASPWKRFKVITLPMISPALFFSLLTGFIGSLQTFSQALLMTQGGPGNSTYFYIYNLYTQAFMNLRMGYSSALAWILFLIILVFTGVQLKLSKWVYYEGER